MRPPTIVPTAAKKIRSSTSSGFQVEPGSAARRLPSHHAAAKPTTYMSPYQRMAIGPIGPIGPKDAMTGSIDGYVSMLGADGNIAVSTIAAQATVTRTKTAF